MSLIPVILSGGSGSRLWPLSRLSFPKPFVSLPDGETLISKTYKRASSLTGVSAIYTITNRDYYFLSKDELSSSKLVTKGLPASFILEPSGRNTAPAIAMAALKIRDNFGPDAKMLVLSADHLIEDHGLFDKTVTFASGLADEGRLVTFGIQPDRPETGYGYIEVSSELLYSDGEFTSYLSNQFVEKPSLDIAKTYIETDAFLWNSGMFCFRADTILDALKMHANEVYTTAISCYEKSLEKNDNPNVFELLADGFNQVPDISIDFAVMEKTDDVVVIPSGFDWSDVGCWQSLGKMIQPDDRGNRIDGEAILLDVNDTMIKSRDRVVAGVGLKDLVIVDTDDALLVSHIDRVQDVKKIVEQLKLDGNSTATTHSTVARPWGTYTVLGEGEGYKIKRIVVRVGASLSLQMHHHRSEHWVVVNGYAEVVNGEQVISLKENESTFIPAGNKHRLINPGLTDLVMIEVQSGSYLGEDDIVRYEDVYGRL